jgi:histone H3/H4
MVRQSKPLMVRQSKPLMVRQSKPLMVRQSKPLMVKDTRNRARQEIRKLALRSGPTSDKRAFQKFVKEIVMEKFPGTRFTSHALMAMQEGAEAWMEHYEGASAEKKKQLVAAQNSALEHSLNNIEEHSLDYIEKLAVEAQEAQTLDYILKQMDGVAKYCERIGLKDVYLAMPCTWP